MASDSAGQKTLDLCSNWSRTGFWVAHFPHFSHPTLVTKLSPQQYCHCHQFLEFKFILFEPNRYKWISHCIDWYSCYLSPIQTLVLSRRCLTMISYYPAPSDVRVMSGLSRKAQNIDPEWDEGERARAVTSWSILTPGLTVMWCWLMIWGMFVLDTKCCYQTWGGGEEIDWEVLVQTPQM